MIDDDVDVPVSQQNTGQKAGKARNALVGIAGTLGYGMGQTWIP